MTTPYGVTPLVKPAPPGPVRPAGTILAPGGGPLLPRPVSWWQQPLVWGVPRWGWLAIGAGAGLLLGMRR